MEFKIITADEARAAQALPLLDREKELLRDIELEIKINAERGYRWCIYSVPRAKDFTDGVKEVLGKAGYQIETSLHDTELIITIDWRFE